MSHHGNANLDNCETGEHDASPLGVEGTLLGFPHGNLVIRIVHSYCRDNTLKSHKALIFLIFLSSFI